MNFIEIIEKYNIPRAPSDHHHHTEGWIQIDCPFCSRDSHRYRMGYNISGGFTNCWVCGSHSLFSVVKEYTGLPNKAVKDIIEQISSLSIRSERKENITGTVQIPDDVGELTEAHIRYLSKRRFDYKEIERLWQVKGIGISSRLQWRLFIPIFYHNKIVSWTTRCIGEKGLRYVSAKPEEEIIHHKDTLYGLDYVRDSVIVCEGPLDVWSIGPGAVATFGTTFTNSQVKHLIGVPNIIVCYDNEDDAQKQAIKLCGMVGAFGGKVTNIVLDAKDPGEAKYSELKKLRKFL